MLTYNEAKELYESARDKTKGKPYGNNTRIVKTEQGYGVKYHNTVVVDILPDRWVLDTGGWQTVTTKQRINENAPINIYQSKHIWYLGSYSPKTDPVYQDGLEVDQNGGILSKIDTTVQAQQEKVLKDIKKYVQGYVKADLNHPTQGDCFICQTNGPTCLQSHIDESYYHTTLLVNAFKHSGFTHMAVWPILVNDHTLVRRVLSKYLKFHLLHPKKVAA